jgi:hypothetical protein
MYRIQSRAVLGFIEACRLPLFDNGVKPFSKGEGSSSSRERVQKKFLEWGTLFVKYWAQDPLRICPLNAHLPLVQLKNETKFLVLHSMLR